MGFDRAPREEHEVTCAECGTQTTVPFKPSGDRPVKCRDCFQKDRPQRDRAGGSFRDRPREEHEVECAECGVTTTVPFKPTGDRPVKCRDCFQKDRPPRSSGGGFRDRGDRGGDRGGDRQMHDTNCTRCGKATSVPFKPTPGRDVLCQDCFRR